MQPNKPVYPAGFVPVGEPLSDSDAAATFRAQQINHVLQQIKAPITKAEKIDHHFKHGRFARLLARFNS